MQSFAFSKKTPFWASHQCGELRCCSSQKDVPIAFACCFMPEQASIVIADMG
jgi:hypothetical protein